MKDSKKRRPSKFALKSVATPLSPFRVKSILVPVDFSTPSKEALARAASVARQFKAKLTLLHVIEPVATPDFAATAADTHAISEFLQTAN